MHRSIEIIIDAAGGISIDAVGFRGTDCQKATAFLEAALGAVKARQRKPEYYRHRRVDHVQRLSE
jgi:hypothetical protein